MDTTSVYTPLPTGATAVNGTGILDEEDYIINMPFLWTAASIIQLDKFNLSLITFGFFNNLAQSDPMTGVTFKDADFVDRGAIDSVASRSAIRYLTVGTAPNRIFKIGIANAALFRRA